MLFAPLNPGVVVIPIEAARKNVAPAVNEHMEMRPSPLRELAHRDRMAKFRFENPPPKIRKRKADHLLTEVAKGGPQPRGRAFAGGAVGRARLHRRSVSGDRWLT